ncbi:MAG: right-handed parallel beta-helix repeat-containing protein [Spirochaetota bacterium]
MKNSIKSCAVPIMSIFLCWSGFAKEIVDIQKLVNDAISNKTQRITLPAGRLYPASDYVMIEKANGLIIEGAGADTVIVARTLRSTFSIFRSTNVAIRDLCIDYDPLPFTQATITAISADRTEFDYEVHAGYPAMEGAYSTTQIYLFDKNTRAWKRDVPDLYFRKNEILSPTRGKLRSLTKHWMDHSGIVVGDYFIFTTRKSHAIQIYNSTSVRVEDVIVYTAPSAAVLCRYMDGDNYFRFTIKRGPLPNGAREERLISTGADGFNYGVGRKGPVLERCDFSFMGDDSVNFHGHAHPVIDYDGGRTVWIASRWDGDMESTIALFRTGDTARLLTYGSFAMLGDVPIASMTIEDAKKDLIKDAVVTEWRFPKDAKGVTVCRVELARPPAYAPKFGDAFTMPALDAPNWAIRDCRFTEHRGIGIRMQSPHGIIERSVLENIKMAAIQIAPQISFWAEANWVNDVIIRNNTIRDCGYDPVMWSPIDRVGYGAIAVTTMTPRPADNELMRLPQLPLNRNIVIASNRIDGCSVAGIFINAANGVRISGNSIQRVNQKDGSRAGTNYALCSTHAITILNSSNVSAVGNRIGAPGDLAQGEMKDYGDYSRRLVRERYGE